jgi:hypothetical protein
LSKRLIAAQRPQDKVDWTLTRLAGHLTMNSTLSSSKDDKDEDSSEDDKETPTKPPPESNNDGGDTPFSCEGYWISTYKTPKVLLNMAIGECRQG